MKDCDCKSIADALRPLAPGATVYAGVEQLTDSETDHRVKIPLSRTDETRAWAVTIQQTPTLEGAEEALVYVSMNSKLSKTAALTELANGRGLFVSPEGSRVEAAPAGAKEIVIDLCAVAALDGITRRTARVGIEVREMVASYDDCNC